MKESRMASWLQMAGNLAILLGLLFVGLQMHQDRQLKRAELAWAGYESAINAKLALLGENPQEAVVRAAYQPDDLSAEDAYVLYLIARIELMKLQRSNLMEELGVTPQVGVNSTGWKPELGTRSAHAAAMRLIELWRFPEAVRTQYREQLTTSTSPDSLRQIIERSRASNPE